MKIPQLIFLLVIASGWVVAQESYENKKVKTDRDRIKIPAVTKTNLSADNFIVQPKDLKLIKPIEGMNYIVNGDTMNFSPDEISSGLTIEELKTIRSNRDSLLYYMTPEPAIDEKKEFPVLHEIRNILGAAKTIGIIIILLLSIF